MTELPRFEWIDKSTGLHCPALVCVADHGDATIEIKDMPILQTKRILSLNEMYLADGKIDRRRLPRIKGYRPQTSAQFIVPGGQTSDPWYALVIIYTPIFDKPRDP